jgi:hypothetical protein
MPHRAGNAFCADTKVVASQAVAIAKTLTREIDVAFEKLLFEVNPYLLPLHKRLKRPFAGEIGKF